MAQSQYTPTTPVYFDRPACPKCGMRMGLTRIEPNAPGIDERTFECHQCGHIESVLVKFR
jgi:hypothetical protein